MLTRELKLKTSSYITDIGQSSENALLCWVSIGTSVIPDFNWNHQLPHEPLTIKKIPKTIHNKTFFGWYSSTAQLFRIKLMRKADIQALEGMFSCNYDDRSTVPVGIYYPSKTVSMYAIVVSLNFHKPVRVC